MRGGGTRVIGSQCDVGKSLEEVWDVFTKTLDGYSDIFSRGTRSQKTAQQLGLSRHSECSPLGGSLRSTPPLDVVHTFHANFSSIWATPGIGQNRDPALATIESPVVAPPSSRDTSFMPSTSERVKGTLGVDVFVAVAAAAYDLRQWMWDAIGLGEASSRHCRGMAVALETGRLMNIALRV